LPDKRLVLRNVTYFDAIHGKMEADKSIVLANGKIEWIGDSSSFDREENDRVLDLDGKYALPGLIDCHVHLEAATALNRERVYMTTPTFYYGYLALKHAQDHLRAGFTTLRDCGGEKWGSSLKKAITEGLYKGPRILVAQYGISQYGNQDMMLPNELLDAFSKNREFSTPSGVDGVTQAVRDRVIVGSDFIKTFTTGGILHGVKSKLDKSLFNEDELRAMVREAHRNNMHVASHAHGDSGIRLAVDTGIDTIEHGSMVSEETAEAMIEKGTYLVPTHRAYAARHDSKVMSGLEPEVVTKQDEVVRMMLDCHRVAFEKGVRFALGTDAADESAPHGTSAKEIALMMTEVGMSAVQALQCATIEAARAIKLGAEIGSIETGKAGDVIVVNSNPLEDVTVLQDLANIEYVIKDASIVAQKGNLVPP